MVLLVLIIVIACLRMAFDGIRLFDRPQIATLRKYRLSCHVTAFCEKREETSNVEHLFDHATSC